MKRVLTLSVYFFFLSLLFFSSCTKENLEIDKQSALDVQTKEQSDVNFCFDNPDNPFDYVGDEHNAALDAVAASPNFDNMSRKEAYELISETVDSRNNVDVDVSYEEAEEALAMINGGDPLAKAASIGLENGKLSQQAHDRVLQIGDILESSPDPVSYGHAMIEFEKEVMLEEGYTDCELEIILGAASVGRHSACYWGNVALNPDSPWHAKLNLGNGNGLWWWWPRIIRIILWDIIGYIWGYIWFCSTFGWFLCWLLGKWFAIRYAAWLSFLAALGLI